MNKRVWGWGLVAAWTAFIYSTLYIVRPICEFLKKHAPFNEMIWIMFVLAAVGIISYVMFRLRWRRAGSYILLLSIVGVYAVILFWLKIPEERIHLIQYGVLACLTVRALQRDLFTVVVYPLAWILTSLLGLGDEGIQHLLPNRYFEWKDVGLNALSAALGLLLWMNFQIENSDDGGV